MDHIIDKFGAPPTPYRRYGFSEMSVGESFYVRGDRSVVANVRRAASAFANRHGWTLSVRKWNDGVRVWRIK